jgi:hypothetical protein
MVTLKRGYVMSVGSSRYAIPPSILAIFQGDGIYNRARNTFLEEHAMRCKVCDSILTDEEAVYKDDNGKFMDTCFGCLLDDGEDVWNDLDMPLEPDDFSVEEDISK